MKYKLEDVIELEYIKNLEYATAVGIDIGSRASKGALLHEGHLYTVIQPSVVSSIETAKQFRDF